MRRKRNDVGYVIGRLKDSTMVVSMILSRIRAFLLRRETVRELSRLPDRDLAGLGISGLQVVRIARRNLPV